MKPDFIKHIEFITDHWPEEGQSKEEKKALVRYFLTSLGLEDVPEIVELSFPFRGYRITCPIELIEVILRSKEYLYLVFPSGRTLCQNIETKKMIFINLDSKWNFVKIWFWRMYCQCYALWH